jgi:hypothetical protein
MILSGPKAWRGSTKDARMMSHFLHSAIAGVSDALRPGGNFPERNN